MNNKRNELSGESHESGCSCCGGNYVKAVNEISRRRFVKLTGAGALGTVALSGMSWSVLAAEQANKTSAIVRKPLVVKPVLTYEIPVRREQTSWRNWGGIQTEQDAVQEIARIEGELKALTNQADFPVSFLPVSGIRDKQGLNNIKDLESADLFVIYAAGGGSDMFDALNNTGKDIIFFCRYKSGPVYLWYEIISPRYLRQHTDKLSVKGIDENDIVIDSQEELMWRLRAMCGLRNTRNSRILAIGGPSAWAQSEEVVLKLVRDKYKLDIVTVNYDELGKLITEARQDSLVLAKARDNTEKYIQDAGIKLETKKQYVENCFVLENVLERLMEKFNCTAVTINNCMGTIMPLAETSACLTLSLLNDAGYLAFCESDFVVVPSGILLAHISGKPVFMNDPTYPNNNMITIAHCTAPRKMDGKKLEPARILTHFESDYGAAPKVEMQIGQIVTNIMPDFAFNRNVGLLGKIIDNPMHDICRSQVDISFTCDTRKVAEQMPGFHWMTVYGDYMRETGYALKKMGIAFENLV